MSGLQSLVEGVVGRLKGEPRYAMSSRYATTELATILWHRGRQMLRGLPLRMRARGVRGIVFRGRRVVVEHARLFSAGAGLILEDGAYINALSSEGISVGTNVTVGRGATLIGTGVIAHVGVGIRMGHRCAIGAGSFLGGQGGITLGDDVILGPAVRLLSENHVFSAAGVPIRAQGATRRGIIIGNDCWIGAGVTVVDGVSIGPGCVIGAGAVVVRSLPPRTVAAGVPAHAIRQRTDPLPVEHVRPASQAAATDSRGKSPLWPEREAPG